MPGLRRGGELYTRVRKSTKGRIQSLRLQLQNFSGKYDEGLLPPAGAEVAGEAKYLRHANFIGFRVGCMFLLLVLGASCRQRFHEPGGPYYFASMAGHFHPFNPVQPIAESDAKKRRAYLVAYYNNEGRLIRLEKYFDGGIQWSADYKYRGSRLVRWVATSAEGGRSEGEPQNWLVRWWL